MRSRAGDGGGGWRVVVGAGSCAASRTGSDREEWQRQSDLWRIVAPPLASNNSSNTAASQSPLRVPWWSRLRHSHNAPEVVLGYLRIETADM